MKMYINREDILKLKLIRNSENSDIVDSIIKYYESHLCFHKNTNYIVFLPYDLINDANKLLNQDIIDFDIIYEDLRQNDLKAIFKFLFELFQDKVELLDCISNFPALENELLTDIKKLKFLLGKIKAHLSTPRTDACARPQGEANEPLDHL